MEKIKRQEMNQAPNSNFDRETFRMLKNQKTGDFNPESGAIYDQQSPDFTKGIKYKEAERVSREVGSGDKLEKLIEDTVDKLDSLELEPAYADNPYEQKLLSEKIKIAKHYLGDSLNHVIEYVDSIKDMGSIKLDPESPDYKDDLRRSDAERQLKHNSLIDSINIINRFIRNQFAKMPDDKLSEFEAREKAANRPLPHVQRIEWPKNIFLPDNLEISAEPGKREQVMDWAIALSESLAKLKEKIK
ncbi:MAG: hypothetical protein PHR00_00190 [Patescibacteria group bacterium]|nr:hypothetical protein [Patescibacteria group bacterium]